MILAVIAVASIVSLVALTSIHLARLQMKSSGSEVERLKARQLAMASIEHAVSVFNTQPGWQGSYALDTEYSYVLGSDKVTWKISDIGNNRRRIDGIGRLGDAQCILSVDVETGTSSLLDSGLLVGGNLTVGSDNWGGNLTVNGAPCVSNATLNNINCNVNANVEAQTITNTGTIVGTQTAPAPVRSLPSSSVFDYYLAIGTTIATTSIDSQLLSPFANPYGLPNPHGIYIIDAMGMDVSISKSRIVGTLVVMNAADVRLNDEVNWEPAHPHFPALLVDGNIEFRISNGNLSESATSTNFNPLLTPYRGVSDVFTNDTYPSALAGIFYCSGDFSVNGQWNRTCVVDGLIIAAGNARTWKTADFRVTYNTAHATTPPPGFEGNQANQIIPDSWRLTPAP